MGIPGTALPIRKWIATVCCVFYIGLCGCGRPALLGSDRSPVGPPILKPAEEFAGEYVLESHALGPEGKGLLARTRELGTRIILREDGTCVFYEMPFVAAFEDNMFSPLFFYSSDGGHWRFPPTGDMHVWSAGIEDSDPYVVDWERGRLLFPDVANKKPGLLTFVKKPAE